MLRLPVSRTIRPRASRLPFSFRACLGWGQFVGSDRAANENRVNALLARMTLDEKIDLIGGDTPFRTHALPRLAIPFFQMADGPVGAHIPAPTTAYAAGIGLAASWDPGERERGF